MILLIIKKNNLKYNETEIINMKKTTPIIGIIAVLGISYIGIAWHTGNVIEKEIDTTIARVTEQINNSQNVFNVQITHSNDEKHIFSTKTHINIALLPKEEMINDKLPLIDTDFTIYHGPFPIAALKQGIFSPQMAWIEYPIDDPKFDLVEFIGARPLITGNTSISYNGDVTLNWLTNGFRVKQNRETHFLSDLEGELGASTLTFTSKSDQSTPSIKLDLDKYHHQFASEYLTLNNLHFTLDGEKQSNQLNLALTFDKLRTNQKNKLFNNMYDFDKSDLDTFMLDNLITKVTIDPANQDVDTQINLGNFTLIPQSSNKQPAIQLEGLSINQKVNLSDARVLSGSFTSSVNSIIHGQQNLGNAMIDIDYQGLDKAIFGEEFVDVETHYNQPIESKVKLNNFSWHNLSGDINIKGSLNITNLDQISEDDNPLDSIDNLTLHVSAPLNVLVRIFAQYWDPHHHDLVDEQVELWEQETQEMLEHMFGDSPLFKLSKGEELGLFMDIDLSKDSNEANINGQMYNKNEVLDLFE